MKKVLLPGTNWQGRLLEHIGQAFEKSGLSIRHLYYSHKQPMIYRITALNRISNVQEKLARDSHEKYNRRVVDTASNYKPDLLFTLSGGKLLPETVETIKAKTGGRTATFVADNPFDSSRDKYYAMSLQHYDFIFVAEKYFIETIRKIAPRSRIFKMTAGYNPDVFFPVNPYEITEIDRQKYECDVSFTGANYGQGAEGAYRSGILSQLGEFNLRIWGYGDWPFRFKYYPSLKRAYKGESLEYSELRKLYTLSRINLNMPSPQIISGLHPRIFDIAAVNGFQIIDEREELWEHFTDREVVTFRSVPELKEKIAYFMKYPLQRNEYVEKLGHKVRNGYSWMKQIEKMLKLIEDKR
jgi:spore maturation protein CgeB